MAATAIGAGFGIDTRELKAFVRATRQASRAAAAGLRVEIRAAGEIVAAEARSIAAQHSTTIAPTIRTRVYGATVSVHAGRGVPLAALYELGNIGASADSDTFRHPVYERGADGRLTPTDGWATQRRYPFLRPAAERTAPAVQARVMKVADRCAKVLEGSGYEAAL